MDNTTWVYIKSEPGLWTVGFYAPGGVWHSDSDHNDQGKAGDRCAYLNGATVPTTWDEAEERAAFDALIEAIANAYDTTDDKDAIEMEVAVAALKLRDVARKFGK